MSPGVVILMSILVAVVAIALATWYVNRPRKIRGNVSTIRFWRNK